MLKVPLLLVLVLVLVCGSVPASSITFADGLLHVIDADNSYPFDSVLVEDGPAGETTRLEMYEGGSALRVRARDASLVDVFGGAITSGLRASDTSIVTLNGGTVYDELIAETFGTLIMTGGTADVTFAISTSVMKISGGMLTSNANPLQATNGIMEISGGDIERTVQASGSAVVTITGGRLPVGIFALENSSITIAGYGFNLPFGEITALSGKLTGTLADGTPLNNVDFGRASSATITLVPEPSTAALLCTGLLFTAACQRHLHRTSGQARCRCLRRHA